MLRKSCSTCYFLRGLKKKISDMLTNADENDETNEKDQPSDDQQPKPDATREKLRHLLMDNKLDNRSVDLEVTETRSGPMIEIFSAAGMEDMGLNVRDMLGNVFPQKKKIRTVKVPEALEILAEEEAQKLIDMDKVTKIALERVEQSG